MWLPTRLTWLVLSFSVVWAEDVRVKEYVDLKTGAKWRSTGKSPAILMKNRKHMLGVIPEPPEMAQRRTVVTHKEISNDDLPKFFDSREEWPQCESTSEIRDQSRCGSCWAFGAAEAMTDRLCIHSNGKITKRLAAADLLSCCEMCGFGCGGGMIGSAWDYWLNDGLVPGGTKEEPSGCMSYPFPKCSHNLESPKYKHCLNLPKYEAPVCTRQCDSTSLNYEQEKIRANSSYRIDNDMYAIMKEIMLNGPIEVAFHVYEDFFEYDSGVYFHTWGPNLGGHAIKLLGWGQEENGVLYWILANSWNEEWGENGFFRILRGDNECGIEGEAYGGLPIIP